MEDKVMRKVSKILILTVVVVCAVGFWMNIKQTKPHVTLETVYGTFKIEEPVLIALLESEGLQRLKHIHQYGVIHYATPTEDYSRYEHSVGVFALLRLYDAPLKEQIAGLLHDVSHTVFSHVSDWMFSNKPWKATYSDDIHGWFLQHSGLMEILEKYGYTTEEVHPQSKNFLALDQELPLMCADRIEYNLQGGLKRGLIDQSDLDEIVNDLRFEEGRWFFTTAASAKQFASISLFMTENVWGAPWGLMVYSWTADALKRAIETGLITLEDLHFSTDDVVWHRLIASSDDKIRGFVEKILNFENEMKVCEPSERDTLVIGKFRGIDPLVLEGHKFATLTEIDQSFRQEYQRVQTIIQSGWPIKIVDHHTAPRGLFPWNIDRPEWLSTADIQAYW